MIHIEIERKFNKFDKYFLDEQNIIFDWQETGEQWRKNVQDILDNYIKEIDINKEYIAFDILDNKLDNEFSVESIYS